jgi:hypothetical protein
MSAAMIEVNPQASPKLMNVGREETPVVVIDEFARDTRTLIDYACAAADYGPDSTSSYPGLRASLPRQYVITVLNAMFRLLFKVYGVPKDLSLRPQNTVYSLITTPEDELSQAQCVPHYASNGPWYLAVLHYLNPGDFCATGLFRHRPTGFERITRERLDEFRRSSEEFVREHGAPPRKYNSITRSNTGRIAWSRIRAICCIRAW